MRNGGCGGIGDGRFPIAASCSNCKAEAWPDPGTSGENGMTQRLCKDRWTAIGSGVAQCALHAIFDAIREIHEGHLSGQRDCKY